MRSATKSEFNSIFQLKFEKWRGKNASGREKGVFFFFCGTPRTWFLNKLYFWKFHSFYSHGQDCTFMLCSLDWFLQHKRVWNDTPCWVMQILLNRVLNMLENSQFMSTMEWACFDWYFRVENKVFTNILFAAKYLPAWNFHGDWSGLWSCFCPAEY